MKNCKTKIAALLIVLLFPAGLSAKIYIKIDQFSTEKFPLALMDFQNKSTNPVKPGIAEEIDRQLKDDLEFTGLFRFISKKAFLEEPGKSGYTVQSIDFANWAVLDAQALIKGWFSLDGSNNLVLEFHLFDVLMQKEILAKRYNSRFDNLTPLVHRMANAIIQALTGEPGIFGSRLAFVGKQTGNKEIYTMTLDGKEVKRITNNGSINLSPSWSKDATRIVFTSFKGGRGSALYIADLVSKEIRSFSKLAGTLVGPVFQPDSGLIAFYLSKKFDRGIFLFNHEKNTLRKLTKGFSIDVSPSFSPDGKEFVFSSNRSGRVHIYRQTANPAEEPKRLTFDGARNVDPDWSPKGDKIVFSGMDSDGHFDIFMMNTDGSGLKRLTYDSRSNEHPSWSPDGRYIVFCSNRTGKYQLYVTRAGAVGEEKQITFTAFDHMMPSWSPQTD